MAPLLLAGVFLGPHGVALLSSGALAAVDPAMPVALAALGVLIGLEFGERRAGVPRGIVAGGVHALVTVAVVAAGLFAAVMFGAVPAGSAWLFAASCGVCAASSLTLPGRPVEEPRRQADTIVEAEVAAARARWMRLLSNPADSTLVKRLLAEADDAARASREPQLRRQLEILRSLFLENGFSSEEIERISSIEAETVSLFNTHRGNVNGRRVSENDIDAILKSSTDVAERCTAWEASKAVSYTHLTLPTSDLV